MINSLKKSHNKIKATWDIIKKEVGRKTCLAVMNTLLIDGMKFNKQDIAECNVYCITPT
jgi:hypothetical protein